LSRPRRIAELLADGVGEPGSWFSLTATGGHMRGTNARRRWWSAALTAAGLFPPRHDFKLHELRHTAASLAIAAGANPKVLQNQLGHASAALTLDRYGHLYGSDVESVGVAMNELLTRVRVS
jgi:integrase